MMKVFYKGYRVKPDEIFSIMRNRMSQVKNLEIESKSEGIFKNLEIEPIEIFSIKDLHEIKNARAGITVLKNISEMLYLDYVNNFLTVEKFALYYGLSNAQAGMILNMGKKTNLNYDLRLRLKNKKRRKIIKRENHE